MAQLEVFTDFSAGEEPEGVAVDKSGNVYTGNGPPAFAGPGDGFVFKFDPEGNDHADSPLIEGVGANGVAGLAIAADGRVFFAWPSPDATVNGVYSKVEGSYQRMDGTENTVVANGLALDKEDNLYIGDSIIGIWKIPADNSAPAAVWAAGGLLDGCFDFGANGIAFWKDGLYVANSARGTVVRIQVEEDGSAGAMTLIAGHPDCFTGDLVWIDGIAFDVHGLLYATTVLTHKLFWIDMDYPAGDAKNLKKLLDKEQGLHNPASIAFGTGKQNRRTLYIANFAVLPWWAGDPAPSDDAPVFGPAILEYTTPVAGKPLP